MFQSDDIHIYSYNKQLPSFFLLFDCHLHELHFPAHLSLSGFINLCAKMIHGNPLTLRSWCLQHGVVAAWLRCLGTPLVGLPWGHPDPSFKGNKGS